MSRLICLVTFVAATALTTGVSSPTGSPVAETAQIQNKDAKGQERSKEQPKTEINPADLKKIDTIVKYSKEYAVRKNGVLLEAKAEAKNDGKGAVLLIHWTLDYTGPRFPLHILKPSLGVGWYNQTNVELYPVDEKGIAHLVTIHPEKPRL